MIQWRNPFRSLHLVAILVLSFWKWILLAVVFLVVLVGALFYLLFLLPFRISYQHETWYFDEIARYESLERPWGIDSKLQSALSSSKPVPWNQRPHRLCQDMIQLQTDRWHGTMSLYTDGLGMYPRQDYFIYAGGTAAPNSTAAEPWYRRLWRQSSFFTMPGYNCVDDAATCNAFNKAYDDLMEQAHGASRQAPAPLRRLLDCDHSPLLCDWFGINAVMLLHVKTGKCHVQITPFEWHCSMRWTWIPLPLAEMPFRRTQKLTDGRVVPVFPSAEEQLRILLEQPDSLEAYGNGADRESQYPSVAHIRGDHDMLGQDEYDLLSDTQKAEIDQDQAWMRQFGVFEFIKMVLMPQPDDM